MIFRYLLFGALLTLSVNVQAGQPPQSQIRDFKSTTSRSDFGRYQLERNDAAAVSAFLISKLDNLRSKNAGILLKYAKNSPGGSHYTFTQTYQGLPVFSSDIMVNVDRSGSIYSLFDDSYDVAAWMPDMTDFSYESVTAFQAYLTTYDMKDAAITAQKMLAYDESSSSPLLCYQLELRQRGRLRYVLVSRDRIIYERDGAMYKPAAAPDSLVTGMVFRPDPLTTAHTVYYGPYMGHDSAYQNYNDADTPQLNLQRVAVPFIANYQAGTFYLQNKYVQLQALSSPVAPVTSVTPAFNYTRSQNGFLDVMVYYHINAIRQHIHDLGFDMGDTLVTPDAHAFAADNSYFVQPQNIYYGTGGVPDAQDADVVVHEYTHFLSWNANQSNTGSSQRGSIDEGLADYNATSYSSSIDTFGWYRMFSWDGHNEYWNGRWVNDPTVYPAVPSAAGLNGIYKYSVIWSSALMQLFFDLGRGTTDSLVYETMYGLAANITLPDAAHQLIMADSALYGGQYHCIIVRDMRDHGLASDSTYCGIYPAGIRGIQQEEPFWFTGYPDRFRIEAAQRGADIIATLYDIAGQRIATYTHVTGDIRPEGLPDGIYVVAVAAGGQARAYKWPLVR